MIVTVLWEDQRGVSSKGFGPHELLLSAVAKELNTERHKIARAVAPVPKKGNGNVLQALKHDLSRLTNSGPVVAVFDWDKLRDLFKKPGTPAPECKRGLADLIRAEAAIPQGATAELVFLIENVESLTSLLCNNTNSNAKKPTPDERDRILLKAAWEPALCQKVRVECASFDRLVKHVAKLCRICLNLT